MRRRQIYAQRAKEAVAPVKQEATKPREACPRCGRDKHKGRCRK